MQIILNGEPFVLHSTPPTVTALVTQLELQQRRIAVEVNREIIPRSAHDQHELQAGDQVEIVHAIGGG